MWTDINSDKRALRRNPWTTVLAVLGFPGHPPFRSDHSKELTEMILHLEPLPLRKKGTPHNLEPHLPSVQTQNLSLLVPGAHSSPPSDDFENLLKCLLNKNPDERSGHANPSLLFSLSSYSQDRRLLAAHALIRLWRIIYYTLCSCVLQNEMAGVADSPFLGTSENRGRASRGSWGRWRRVLGRGKRSRGFWLSLFKVCLRFIISL